MVLVAIAILVSALGSLFFSTLTYSLRDFSRARLGDLLESAGKGRWLEPTLDHKDDLIFVTAVGRLLFNVLTFLGIVRMMSDYGPWTHYLGALAITLVVSLICSVAVPHALAMHAGEAMIAACVRFLHILRGALYPITALMHFVDRLVIRAAGASAEPQAEQIEQDILSVVEDGQKEGIVDEQEREMIVSVIEFRDTQVGQIMTARPEIVAIEIHAGLEEIKRTVEESGHSRIPVYDETLDHITGVLYARDLLKHLGLPPEQFEIHSAMRPAVFVPESKPLRDLLREFRAQKVHIAIVLDEYGGTAGLVTIEDILEELVGEIADEHEPAEPPLIKQIDGHTFEADARLPIEDANRRMGLNLPTDAGYGTLGGFVSVALGRIPAKGTTFVHENARLTILDAQPQRVKQLRIELQPQTADNPR